MNSGKTAARSDAKFCMTIYLSILRVVFRWWPSTIQGQVTRSLGMTRRRHFFAYLSLCQSRSCWPNILKLGGWSKAIDAYNLFISDFSIWWPKVGRSILWPRHYTAMGEKRNPSPTHQARLFYHELSYVRVLLIIQVQILIGDLHRVIRGHMTSSEVTNRFWLITHDWKELQAWAWSHCACIVTTNRVICNTS